VPQRLVWKVAAMFSRPVASKRCAVAVFALSLLRASLAVAQAGVAPNGDPGAGFQIEGDLESNSPTANTTDWVAGLGGIGIALLSNAGVPVDPTHTFHLVDAFDPSDDVFTGGGSFLGASPNTHWLWTTNVGVVNKDNLNHALVHFSTDGSGHLWLTCAGDRKATNSGTFINFELLQNTLVKNGDGTFYSTGPDTGRTVGDLLFTLQLIDLGSNQALLFVNRWTETSPGVFAYALVTPLAGTAFVASNTGAAVSVPYLAYGLSSYPIAQFGEMAADLTALNVGRPDFRFKTIFISNRSSTSNNAALRDLFEPLQVSFSTTVAVDDASPVGIALGRISPNPASGPMRIMFSLASAARVRLDVVDLAGREVTTLAQGWREAGTHEVTWNPRSAGAGIYFVRYRAGGVSAVRRVVVLE
jgi:hypothetical protein